MSLKEKSGAVPTLVDYLDRVGRKERGDEFEDFADVMLRTLDQVEPGAPHLAIMLRAMKITMVATVEFANVEIEKGGEVAEIFPALARAMGWCVISALASAQDNDELPPRSFARLFAEEFRQGAVTMLDAFQEEEEP